VKIKNIDVDESDADVSFVLNELVIKASFFCFSCFDCYWWPV